MSISNLFKLLFGSIFALVMISFILLLAMNRNKQQILQSHETRFLSYQRADELRQSSDDLTRYARTYVISGDPIYEKYYWEILDIRNGKEARPKDYHRIYWDLVTNNSERPREKELKKALQEMMKDLGFSDAEFAKLKEAQANSDALVKTEEIAMDAIKNKINPNAFRKPLPGETNRQFAIRIMHDQDYHIAKKNIMKPIDGFFELLENRTREEVLELKKQQEIIINLMFIILISILGLVGYSYFIIRSRVSKPLKKFVIEDQIMQKVGEGDLTVHALETSNDEVGIIMKEFNKMVDSQRQLITNIAEAIQVINSSAKEITDQTSEATSILSQIRSNSVDIHNLSKDQTGFVKNAEKNSQEISLQLSRNSLELMEIEKIATSARNKSHEGVIEINRISNEMESIQNTVMGSARLMGELDSKSKSITEIIEVISGIADQTNLLALNAAIEAARAGEFGKGFSIVASEVSKLADQSINSSIRIKKLIQALNKDTEALVVSVKVSSDEVSKGTNQIKKVGKKFEDINSGVKNLDEKISSLNRAIQQLNMFNQNMVQDMQEILKLQTRSEQNSAEISKSLDIQFTSSQKMSASSEELFAISDQLNKHVKKFHLH